MVATWASVSIISTPGISGAPGKCPWKKSSLTVTFLTALMPASRLVLGDGVDQRRGIAIAEPVDGLRDVDDGHATGDLS